MNAAVQPAEPMVGMALSHSRMPAMVGVLLRGLLIGALAIAVFGPILNLPCLDTLNIGHSIVCRAVFVGLEQAVREMLKKMRSSSAVVAMLELGKSNCVH